MSPDNLQRYMQNSWLCSLVTVDTFDIPNIPEDGYTYYISLRGCAGLPPAMPLLVADNTDLAGGRDGTTPEIEITRVQAGSTDLMVEPLNSEYLFMAADKPQVIATVKGIQSVCGSDCSFEFSNNIPTLTGANLDYNSARLILSVTYPNATGIDLSSITVTIDDTPCTGLVGSIYNFNCTLPKVTAGTPRIRAGEYLPIVYFKKYG